MFIQSFEAIPIELPFHIVSYMSSTLVAVDTQATINAFTQLVGAEHQEQLVKDRAHLAAAINQFKLGVLSDHGFLQAMYQVESLKAYFKKQGCTEENFTETCKTAIKHAWNAMITVNKEALFALIDRSQAGENIALITNSNHWHTEAIQAQATSMVWERTYSDAASDEKAAEEYRATQMNRIVCIASNHVGTFTTQEATQDLGKMVNNMSMIEILKNKGLITPDTRFVIQQKERRFLEPEVVRLGFNAQSIETPEAYFQSPLPNPPVHRQRFIF